MPRQWYAVAAKGYAGRSRSETEIPTFNPDAEEYLAYMYASAVVVTGYVRDPDQLRKPSHGSTNRHERRERIAQLLSSVP